MDKELKIWVENSEKERFFLKDIASTSDQRYMRYQNPDIIYRLPAVGIERFVKALVKSDVPFEIKSKLHVYVDKKDQGEFRRNEGKADFDHDDFYKKISFYL